LQLISRVKSSRANSSHRGAYPYRGAVDYGLRIINQGEKIRARCVLQLRAGEGPVRVDEANHIATDRVTINLTEVLYEPQRSQPLPGFDVEQFYFARVHLKCVFRSRCIGVFGMNPGNGLDVAKRKNEHRIWPCRLYNTDVPVE
jgi:hypothetical protein